MDPAVALPLHFTLEAIGIGASALVLAWALLDRRWLPALGALAFGVGQALHTGQFLAQDDDAALIALRLAGVALLALAALPVVDAVVDERWTFASGLGGLFGGALWGAFVGGGADDLSVGPHVLIAAGSLVLVAWTWRRSRASVRLRVVAAFVAVLALAIVVAGGAVSRAAVVDKRNAQTKALGVAATATGSELVSVARQLERRAATASPAVAFDPNAVKGIAPGDNESAAVLDTSGHVLAQAGKVGLPSFPFGQARGGAIAQANDGATHIGFEVGSDVPYVLGSAPVFRPGTGRVPTDVFRLVAIARRVAPVQIRSMARSVEPGAEISLTQDGRTVRTADTTRSGLLVVTTTLPNSNVELVVATTGARATEAATSLIRALLVALLAAALLAVIVAMWLADRVARPIIDLADEAERAKTDFLTTAAHELRTPLTPIRGYTELLRGRRVSSRSASGYLDEIGQAAGRLERIVTLLVDVAAMEAGRFPIERDDTTVKELLDKAAARWRGVSKAHKITVDVPDSLPGVSADPAVLARVLDELIDNALKFSPDGGAVGLRARRTRKGVEVSVADVGVGLDADRAKALTRAFTQAEGGDIRRFGGLGLGLAYVTGALGAHGVRLSIQSNPQGGESSPKTGTTFSFVLPTTSSVTRMPARASR
jgi:signal transduction histidine kinase